MTEKQINLLRGKFYHRLQTCSGKWMTACGHDENVKKAVDYDWKFMAWFEEQIRLAHRQGVNDGQAMFKSQEIQQRGPG